jgi:hypothetical protein
VADPAFVTAPGPEGKWWEHGPVGPGLEFALGKDGWFGGGEAGTLLNQGTNLTASIHFFGSHPDIVAWVGIVSDQVSGVEVHLDDGDNARTIDLHWGPQGFPRLFWFFLPRGAVGHVLALDADGRELQREDLVDADVDPGSNAGTSVNAFGYPAGRPPPGWPDDPTEYAPGEGPRHAEDFHLHEATFPLYVVPPGTWEGYAGGQRHLGRASRSGRVRLLRPARRLATGLRGRKRAAGAAVCAGTSAAARGRRHLVERAASR